MGMKKTLLFIIIFAIFLIVATPLISWAQTITIPNPLKYDKIEDIIKAITGLLKVIAIPLGTIMIIVSGIQYMTSAGNEEKASKAKKTMLYTIIGLAIVIAVDFIVGLLKEILGKVE